MAWGMHAGVAGVLGGGGAQQVGVEGHRGEVEIWLVGTATGGGTGSCGG